MFTLDATIDAVQTGKKQLVKTFVHNEAVADALNQFVDAQTEYTKTAIKSGTETFSVITSELNKAAQTAVKFDYAKFSESIAKAYAAIAKKQ